MKKILLICISMFCINFLIFGSELNDLIITKSEAIFQQINPSKSKVYLDDFQNSLKTPDNGTTKYICDKIEEGDEAYIVIGILNFVKSSTIATNYNSEIAESVVRIMLENPSKVIAANVKARRVFEGVLDKSEKSTPIERLIDSHIYGLRDEDANLNRIKVLDDYIKNFRDTKAEGTDFGDSKNEIIQALTVERQFYKDHYEQSATRGFRGYTALICLPSFLILDHYSMYSDGKWYVGAVADGVFISSVYIGGRFPNPLTWFGIGTMFAYPVVNIIDGYVVKEKGRIIRGLVSLALGALSIYSAGALTESGDTEYPYDKRVFDDVAFWPDLNADYAGINVRMNF